MKYLGYTLGFIAVVVLLTGGNWVYRYYTAEIRGVVGAQERIESTNSRLFRYQRFFDLCTAVEREKSALAAQQERLSHLPPDSGEASRVRSAIAALTANIQGNVSQYNNQSATYTDGRFKDHQLPYKLSTEGVTVCIN